MSDKTPESEGLDPADRSSIEGDDVAGDEFGHAGNDVVDSESELDGAEDTLVDERLPETDPAAAPGASPIRRRTSKAPVRKKDRRPVDPEGDDEVIADLEEGFTPEEKAAAGGATATRTIPRRTSKAPVKKDHATSSRGKQLEEHDPYGPVGPATFVKQSAGELNKVVWPTWPQLLSYFTAVLMFVLFFIAFVGLLDLFFGWGLLQLFGDKG